MAERARRRGWRRWRAWLGSHYDAVVSMALKLFLAFGVVLEVMEGNWLMAAATAGVIIAMFVPVMLGQRFGVKIPSEFELLAVVFVFASLFLGELRGYYDKYWWWDIALHSSSGLVLGILGFLLVHVMNEHEGLHLHMKPSFVALFSFLFALALGTLWEIFEWMMDYSFGMTMQKSLDDTMSDLVVDALGAVVIAVLGYSYLQDRSRKSFLERWTEKFMRINRGLWTRRRP